MNTITASELAKLLLDKKDIQLIDVRERYENSEFNIGGDLFPLGEILQHIDEIDKEKPVIVYCRKGIRSQIAIQRLQQKFPFKNLINLAGGMDAWQNNQ